MNESIAVIGDVHGDFDRLQRALDDLETCVEVIVLVGDYIDRGEQSREVLDLLIDKKRARGDRLVTLRGNHEAALMEFLEGGDIANYAAHGGLRTINSYGFRTVRGFFNQFPNEHLKFLQATTVSYVTSDLFVSHGGFDVEDTTNFDSAACIHGDSRIFEHRGAWPRPLTIFGHFIQDKVPYQSGNFICLDTGCGTIDGGPLSAVVLPGVAIRQY